MIRLEPFLCHDRNVNLRVYKRRTVDPLDFLVLLIPIFSFLEFELIGRVFAPEILLSLTIPFLLYSGRGREINLALPRTFLFLVCLWLIGQILTDLVRQTPFSDWTRGWAKIALTMVNFAALSMLIERRMRRIVLFTFGLALGGILTYFLNPSEYAFFYPWKFGYGFGVTFLVMLLATGIYRRKTLISITGLAIIAAIGFINIMMGYRSLGGVISLTLSFITTQSFLSNRKTKIKPIGKLRFILLAIVLFTGGWAVFTLYGVLAQSGVLGYEAMEKYETQSAGAYGVIIGGRSEVLSAVTAIKDSPLLGHGSWAKDCRYIDILTDMRRKLGYFQGEDNDECLIPSHSITLGAWVESGILGGIVWLWVAITVIKTLVAVFQNNIWLGPLIVFIGFLLLWDLAFSPYGATGRFVITFYCSALFSVWALMNQSKPLLIRKVKWF